LTKPAFLTDLRSEAVKTPDYAESYVRQAGLTRPATEDPAVVLVQYVEEADGA